MAVEGPVQAPVLNAMNNFAQKERDDKKKAAEKAYQKELKRRAKETQDRMDQRRGVYGYSGNPGKAHEDPSIASKLSHMGSMDPNVLVGEILAIFTIQFFQLLFQTQYLIQKREFNDAVALDQTKEFNIASGLQEDDGIRLAYEPLRDVSRGAAVLNADGTHQVYNGKLLYNAETTIRIKDGKMEYPPIYPVDAAGNVNYRAVPNTDGTADRHSIRANGYVPKADWKESHENQWLWFQKEMTGSGGFTAAQRSQLQMDAHEAARRGPKKDKELDSAEQAAFAAQQAARQQMVQQQQRAKP